MGYQFRYFVDILELLLLLHLVPDLDPRTNFFRKDFSQVVPFAIMCTLSGALFWSFLQRIFENYYVSLVVFIWLTPCY